MFPSPNEHQPAAHEQAASDGIADDAVLLMGANESQAGVAGLTRRATCLARRRFVTDGDSSTVVATRDIRLCAPRMRPVRGLTAVQMDHSVPLGMVNSSPRLGRHVLTGPAYRMMSTLSRRGTSSPITGAPGSSPATSRPPGACVAGETVGSIIFRPSPFFPHARER